MKLKSGDISNKIEKSIKSFIAWIEIVLAIFIIVTVIVSGKDIAVLIYKVFLTEASSTYEILQGLFSHILLLVVGLELALMLISHTASNVLEVILYAIARKMLISNTTSVDLILGVLSLAILFSIDKFLHTKDTKRHL